MAVWFSGPLKGDNHFGKGRETIQFFIATFGSDNSFSTVKIPKRSMLY